VAINVLRHPELPCYCFGTTSGERISTRSLVRLGLSIAAVFIILLGQQFGIVTTWSGEIIVTSQVLIQGLLKATLTAFVLVIGIWILALPDLVQLRGQRISQRE
jgi:hypothetical protein